jgi:hypothetical protein
LYQWQASFDPLLRKYEQAKTKTLTKTETRKLKCLIAKQVTDDEKVILAGINPSFTIEGIDKGTYVLRTFQDKLAANASRFQSKKYTPDARILTYLKVRLKVRAQDFNVPVPSFMKKRTQEKGKGTSQAKRGRSHTQQSRSRTHGAYVGESLVSSTPTTGQKAITRVKVGGHPKGNWTIKARINHPMEKVKVMGEAKVPLFPKAKALLRANSLKVKDTVRPTQEPHLATLVCGFCHLHGHHESNCRKRHALHNSESYQQARSQFNSRQQLLFDQLENSLFAPNVCSWCLQSGCNAMSCHAPEDTDFYVDTTHLFQETLLPYVQNAKLGLPVDNAAPLMPQHFAFDDADWGQYTESAFEPSLETWEHDNASDMYESSWEASMNSNADQYLLEDDSGEQDEEYVVEQNDSQLNGEEHGQYDSFVAKLEEMDAGDASYDNLDEDEGQ